MSLEGLLRAPLPTTVDGAVERMRALEQALPERDGVLAFTRLYRAVTEAVDQSVRPGAFADPRFTRLLGIICVDDQGSPQIASRRLAVIAA